MSAALPATPTASVEAALGELSVTEDDAVPVPGAVEPRKREVPSHGLCLSYMHGHDCNKVWGCTGAHIPKAEREPCRPYVATGGCSRGKDCFFPHVLPKKLVAATLAVQVSADHVERAAGYIGDVYAALLAPRSKPVVAQAAWHNRHQEALVLLETKDEETRLQLIKELGVDTILAAVMCRYYPFDAMSGEYQTSLDFMSARLAEMATLKAAKAATSDAVAPSVRVRFQCYPASLGAEVATAFGSTIEYLGREPTGPACTLLAGAQATSPRFTVEPVRKEYEAVLSACLVNGVLYASVWEAPRFVVWGHMSLKREAAAGVAAARCRAFHKLREIQLRTRVFHGLMARCQAMDAKLRGGSTSCNGCSAGTAAADTVSDEAPSTGKAGQSAGLIGLDVGAAPGEFAALLL